MMARTKLTALLLSGTVLGIPALDRFVDTGPVICAIDPACRPMTQGEIALAKPIFGDTIPYEEVRIFNRSPTYNLSDKKNIAFVHHSNMYLSERMGPNRYDMKADDDHAEDFVHELAHLWQYHARGFSNKSGDQSYSYNLKDHPRFEDFNQEQQAEIVLEYFNRHRTLTNFLSHARQRQDVDIAFRDAKIGEYCAALAPYEAKVSQSLPVTPVSACPKPKLP